MANYWDLGDKAAAQHFTEDFLKLLLPGLKIRTVTFLDKDAVKEAFKGEVKSDHVVKILLEDGGEIAILQEFQHYRDPEIWRRMWEYTVLLHRKHGLHILPILVDYGEIKEPAGIKAVEFVTGTMLQLSLGPDQVDIATFTCLTLRVNLLLDQEVLAGSQPGLLVLLPFTRTGMTPAQMLQAVIRRLEELQVSPEYSSKIITMLAYYLEGKHSEAELAEFNEVLRRWEEMSIQLRYIGKEWREEGRAEGRAEGIRRSLAAYLNIRFNFDEETTAQKLAGLHDLKVLEELAKAVYAAEDPVKAGLVIEQYTAGQSTN